MQNKLTFQQERALTKEYKAFCDANEEHYFHWDLPEAFCTIKGFKYERTHMLGMIGNGQKSHILRIERGVIAEEQYIIFSAYDNCGSSRWSPFSGHSRLSILGDNLSECTCKKCQKDVAALMAPPISAEKPARKKGAVAKVWAICENHKEESRKVIIENCIAAGINEGTAATQYAKWKKAQK